MIWYSLPIGREVICGNRILSCSESLYSIFWYEKSGRFIPAVRSALGALRGVLQE